MIVGWRVATNMRTDMVLDAVDMARWQPQRRSRRPRRAFRRRQPVHVDPVDRTSRRDRRPPLDRLGRGQLRQRARRDRQRLLQGRADLRPRTGTVEDRRRRRTRHLGLGALAQHPTAPRLPQRPHQPSSKGGLSLPSRARSTCLEMTGALCRTSAGSGCRSGRLRTYRGGSVADLRIWPARGLWPGFLAVSGQWFKSQMFSGSESVDSEPEIL